MQKHQNANLMFKTLTESHTFAPEISIFSSQQLNAKNMSNPNEISLLVGILIKNVFSISEKLSLSSKYMRCKIGIREMESFLISTLDLELLNLKPVK